MPFTKHAAKVQLVFKREKEKREKLRKRCSEGAKKAIIIILKQKKTKIFAEQPT